MEMYKHTCLRTESKPHLQSQPHSDPNHILNPNRTSPKDPVIGIEGEWEGAGYAPDIRY